MDENASRAVFVGVSVFIAIITITLILNFYRTAKDSAAVANRYDVTISDSNNVNKVLSKEEITGTELRYLMNYYADSEEIKVEIYDVNKEVVQIDPDLNYEIELDTKIKPNYNYELEIIETKVGFNIKATFKN